jgi:uncharacterized spore protein YtfJ
MEDTERLLKGAVEELDRLLSAKNVLAAPIEKEGLTVIPLVSYGFGFGAGGGADETKGRGGGTGGASGIKPAVAIIIDKDAQRTLIESEDHVMFASLRLAKAILHGTCRLQ